MEPQNEILCYLEIDEVKNVSMINFINDYPICYIGKVGNSIFVKGTSDRNWIYVSSKSEEELKDIKGKLKREDNCFAVIEDWMIPILAKGSQIKWKLSTMRVFLPTNTVILDSKYAVFDLKIDDAEPIFENSDYKEYISIDYISDRIQKGLSAGIYDAGKLVAWGITQDDGAIGFLHVLPEYRLRGYGRDITIDLIKKVRKLGELPFAHIEEKNEKSMRLAISLGFMKDRVVNWIEIS